MVIAGCSIGKRFGRDKEEFVSSLACGDCRLEQISMASPQWRKTQFRMQNLVAVGA
jgi:hypothetical protein